MNQAGPERPLALILSRLGGQSRTRLLEVLPQGCREAVLTSLETHDLADRAAMTPVEQSLALQLDYLLGDREPEADTFREFHSLRVADLVSLVLLKVSSDAVSEILVHLPHTLQAECVQTLASQDWSAMESHLGADESSLIRELDDWLEGDPRRARPDFAVAILRNMTNARQLRALLTSIHHRDSETAKQIQASLFSLEDLRNMSDREIQTVTRGIDDWDIALAFHDMSTGLRRRILSNVSRRRSAQLEDDSEYLSDSDEDEVEGAQERILMRARALYESGQIQTYLGSVSPDPIDPEDEEDEEELQRAPRKRGPVTEVEEETRTSYRSWAFGCLGLAAVLTVWLLGVERSPQRSRSRTGASVADFSTRERLDSGGKMAGAEVGSGASAGASGVTASDGDVFVVSNGERRPIEESTIKHGDILETGEEGRALVSLTRDPSKAELGPESELQVGDEDQPVGPPTLRLRVGNVWVQVKNPALEVHSPVLSVTASSGALYQVRVVPSSATTVNVVQGTAWIQSKVGDEDLAVVGEGKSLRIEPRGAVDVRPIEERSRPRWLIF